MTREEVINAARAALEEATGSETAVCYLTSEDKEWLEMAIKALEQEPIFDKIKAKIEQLHYHPKLDFIKNDEVVDMALEIIDKYKAESEGNNADSN